MSTYETLRVLNLPNVCAIGARHGTCKSRLAISATPHAKERKEWHIDALFHKKQLPPRSATENLDVLATHRSHPVLDLRKRPHMKKFTSHVKCSVSSPAQAAAIYCMARLFPARWRSIYAKSFHGQTFSSKDVDLYNAAFAPPSPLELLEISEIFASHVNPGRMQSRRFIADQGEFFEASVQRIPQVFGVASNRDIYRIVAFLDAMASSVDEARLSKFFSFLASCPRCTKKSCRALHDITKGRPGRTDDQLASIFAQFNVCHLFKDSSALYSRG